jgi:urea transporter
MNLLQKLSDQNAYNDMGIPTFIWYKASMQSNRIHVCGVMVSVLVSSVVDHGLKPWSPKAIKLVFVASPLSTQY